MFVNVWLLVYKLCFVGTAYRFILKIMEYLYNSLVSSIIELRYGVILQFHSFEPEEFGLLDYYRTSDDLLSKGFP